MYHIVYCINNVHLRYAGVSIQSLYDSCDKEKEYTVTILYTENLTSKYMENILGIQTDKFHIKFKNVENLIKEDKSKFFVSNTLSEAAYYRLYIPEIFSEEEKVLYLDTDTLIRKDVSKLIDTDLENNAVAMSFDIDNKNYNEDRNKYILEKLHMEPEFYCCSGVTLYNIQKCIEIEYKKKCFEKLDELKEPLFHDQDLTNSVCYGLVKELPMEWHYQLWSLNFYMLGSGLISRDNETYMKLMSTAGIYHFGGNVLYKPWLNNENSGPYARWMIKEWWETAEKLEYSPYLKAERDMFWQFFETYSKSYRISVQPGLSTSIYAPLFHMAFNQATIFYR